MMKQVQPARPPLRERVKWLLAPLCAFVLLCAVSGPYIFQARSAQVVARKRELPVYCVDRDDRKIAISFDAAWGGDKTLRILDILKVMGGQSITEIMDELSDRMSEFENDELPDESTIRKKLREWPG